MQPCLVTSQTRRKIYSPFGKHAEWAKKYPTSGNSCAAMLKSLGAKKRTYRMFALYDFLLVLDVVEL